jgi:transcriptional antiterminator RfaH
MAREHLERKDVLVFLPKIRQVSFRKNSEQERIEPLFPSYIFARFTIPDEYYNVKWTRGVKRIVGNGQMPVPLDDSIVVFLKQRANEKGLIQPDFNLKEGDKVRVRRGPLQGLWGVIQGRVDARGRVRVLMDILHAGAKVEVPCSFLARHD